MAEKQLGTLAWEPVPGSEATAELSNTETRNDSSPWGERPPRIAYAAAKLMMLGVVDDLKGLERLLIDPVPVIGPTVMARSAIEIASGAWWLMEPGIGARRRVCRILSNSFVGAREREQAAYGFEDLVDEIIYSHECGMSKPDPGIHALACERLRVETRRRWCSSMTPGRVSKEHARRVSTRCCTKTTARQSATSRTCSPRPAASSAIR